MFVAIMRYGGPVACRYCGNDAPYEVVLMVETTGGIGPYDGRQTCPAHVLRGFDELDSEGVTG